MESEPKDFGAVAVDGIIKYELLEHNSRSLRLRNMLEPEQEIVIDLIVLRGIASILNKAAREFGVD